MTDLMFPGKPNPVVLFTAALRRVGDPARLANNTQR
jgi:hypothetical protein